MCHFLLSNYKNLKRVVGGSGGKDKVTGLWSLGRVCAMASAVNYVSPRIHRPVPTPEANNALYVKLKKKP